MIKFAYYFQLEFFVYSFLNILFYILILKLIQEMDIHK